mgnify:CR=1 FL=1|tara:strand:+ start:1257 stop:2087 length:831 start_codon:yes stop_codon:yes gene_type:complete
MTNLKSGLSGCKIDLLNDNILRKYSSSEEYNKRLLLQIKKQSLFSHFVLPNIDSPRVYNIQYDVIHSFDMEYVSGFSFDEYFLNVGVKEVECIVNSLYGYFDFLIDNSRIYHSDVAKKIFDSKLNSMKDSEFMSFIKKQTGDLKVPHSFCHGDLTFANIIFHPKRLYFIDFLDSFVDSYLVDLAKLKQDLFYCWNLKIQRINNLRINQIFSYVWKKIEERYKNHLDTKAFKIIDALTLLRIDPYLTNDRHRSILKTLVTKTDLYEDFNSSYGGKVI